MLNASQLRRLAVISATDPRTIQRFFRGEPIRPGNEERIRGALEALAISALPQAGEVPKPGMLARVIGDALERTLRNGNQKAS
jgi:hypothetical protein